MKALVLLPALFVVLSMIAPLNGQDRSLHKLQYSVFPLSIPAQSNDGQVILANICTVASINTVRHLFVTAAHCVLNEKGEIGAERFYVGHADATVLEADTVRDLAILLSDQPAVALKLRRADVTYETFLRVASYQLGLYTFMLTRGYVITPYAKPAGWEKAYMLHSVYGCGGSSGGPVLDSNDQLVGVEQVGLRSYEPCSGIGGASTHEQIVAYRAYFE